MCVFVDGFERERCGRRKGAKGGLALYIGGGLMCVASLQAGGGYVWIKIKPDD
jgi:hypothetical protein